VESKLGSAGDFPQRAKIKDHYYGHHHIFIPEELHIMKRLKEGAEQRREHVNDFIAEC